MARFGVPVAHHQLTQTAEQERREPSFLIDLLRAMRPKQWIKNTFVFAALIFAVKWTHPDLVLKTIAAFLLFGLVSSGIYLLNDAADAEADRLHPIKRHRPIASGRISVAAAAVAAAVLILASIGLGYVLDPLFALVAGAYAVLMVAYTFYLKQLVIIDVFVIAGGFVLRAAAGAAVIHVQISPWLYLCTILLSLFLGFGKRRHELLVLEDGAAGHRRNLEEYTGPFLDDLINIVAGATIICYALYTFFASTVPQNHAMMVTIPFVLYGIFRYLLLIHRRDIAGAPEEALWRDVPLLLDLVFWALAAALVRHIYG
jgi:4-hydroxybenzoate polyprenyltransferase